AREKAASADATGALLLHQPGSHQHLDVAGHRLQGDVEGGGELGHEQRLVTQPLKGRAADRSREREKKRDRAAPRRDRRPRRTTPRFAQRSPWAKELSSFRLIVNR